MARKVENLTSSAFQQINLVGDKGEIIPFKLAFRPSQNAWFFDLTYLDFELKGAMLVLSPNILRQYRNIVPFGICCITSDGYEPQFITDFLENRVQLYLLNAAEVALIEEDYTV